MPPTQFKLADTGEVFFASGGATAVFQWDQESGAPQRLVQTNDRVEVQGTNLPGPAAGGLLDSTGRLLQTNAAGHAAILVSAAVKSSMAPGSIFLFDGTSYREMKTPLDSFSQLALNNLDRVVTRCKPWQ